MVRAIGLILLILFAAARCGVIEHLHNLQHDHHQEHPDSENPGHDESNCRIHANLHAPISTAGPIAPLILLGLFVAFLTQITPPLVSQQPMARIDCRGPPMNSCPVS